MKKSTASGREVSLFPLLYRSYQGVGQRVLSAKLASSKYSRTRTLPLHPSRSTSSGSSTPHTLPSVAVLVSVLDFVHGILQFALSVTLAREIPE